MTFSRYSLSLLLVTTSLLFIQPAVAQEEERTAGATAQTQVQNASETYRQLNLFGDVFEQVRANYVDEVGDEALIEAAITGMLSSLDPHSSYMNAKSYKDMQVQTRGNFGGLGIEVSMEKLYVELRRNGQPINPLPWLAARKR